MPHPSDPELLVLHTLRLKGFVDVDVIAAACGQLEARVDAALARLQECNYVSHRGGRISGWSLTPAGRIEGEKRLAAELDAAGARAVVERAYHRFLTVNEPFLELCTRWQLREIADDGTDHAHDDSAIAELDRFDDVAQHVCADLAVALARFAYYNGRFAAARLRVHAGDYDWFAKPMIDSYHTVWFELHENLLATLNIERSSEAR